MTNLSTKITDKLNDYTNEDVNIPIPITEVS